MLSLPQLIKLNHDLRESLTSGWMAHKSGPNDGRFWPLMHLAVQVLRKHEALVLLAERGFGQEAGMMLRSMFESTVNAMWIAKDLDARLERYHAYQFFSAQKYRNLADKWGIKTKRPQTEHDKSSNRTLKQMAEEKGWRELPKYGFRANEYWSGKPLKKMAEEIGWLHRYEFIYRIYSDVIHSGASSAADYISQSDSGVVSISVGPQLQHSEICLREGYLYLIVTFEVANECVGLGLEPQLDKAWGNIPKVLPGSPDIMRGHSD